MIFIIIFFFCLPCFQTYGILILVSNHLKKQFQRSPLTWFVFLWSIVLFSHRRSLLRQMPDRNLLSFIIRFFWVDGFLPREALHRLHWDRQKDSAVNFYHLPSVSMLSKLQMVRGARCTGLSATASLKKRSNAG